MRLHQNVELFRQAITATSQKIGIAELYIEKDYWVCYALQLLYTSKVKEEIVFKGGTALSKCFDMIERFSEDIDLVLLQKEEETGNQLKKRLKKVTEVMCTPFEEEDLEGVTNKMGMIRKVAYNYPKVVKGNYGQVRDRIIVEVSWLGHFEPYSKNKVATYIYDMMVATEQITLAKQYNMLPFDVLVLDLERTLCEKIMSLVRFSYDENPMEALNNKIRHLYDIYKLLNNEEIKTFFNANAFESMLLKVAKDDISSFKNDNKWLNTHPKESVIFKSPETIWEQLKNTYTNDFSKLVYGDLPKEQEILETIKTVSTRLETIKWTLKV